MFLSRTISTTMIWMIAFHNKSSVPNVPLMCNASRVLAAIWVPLATKPKRAHICQVPNVRLTATASTTLTALEAFAVVQDTPNTTRRRSCVDRVVQKTITTKMRRTVASTITIIIIITVTRDTAARTRKHHRKSNRMERAFLQIQIQLNKHTKTKTINLC